MEELKQVVYKTRSKSTGGREGESASIDGKLKVKLSTPKEMGGAGGEGTNPEQLFASGYSACFLGAMKFVAQQGKIKIPADVSVEAEVGIGPITGGFGIEVALFISLPDMDKKASKELVEKAHQVCPYSNATRGNIKVELNIN